MDTDIREARPADLPAMLGIYNEVVANSTAIYCDDPGDLAFMQAYLAGREQAGFPVFVAESSGQIMGYGSFGAFRTRPGYRFTVEHSVHTRADMRGEGVGSALMAALIVRAKEDGYRVMLGAIDSDNAGSLEFHRRLGFEIHSALPNVGRKFGRWLNMTFVTLQLGEG